MDKFKHWLLGREFTWITDCSGILKFFEMGHEATHTMQRWKMEMLRFNFTIVHRPGKMLTECDLLSRYNMWTDKWRHAKPEPTDTETSSPKTMMSRITNDVRKTQPKELHAIPMSFIQPQVIGPKGSERTALADKCDKGKTLIIIGAGGQPITEAMDQIGLTPMIIDHTDENPYWQQIDDMPNLEKLECRMDANPSKTAEWIVIPRMQDIKTEDKHQRLQRVLTTLIQKRGAHTVMVTWTTNDKSREQEEATPWNEWIKDVTSKTKPWTIDTTSINNEKSRRYDRKQTHSTPCHTNAQTYMGQQRDIRQTPRIGKRVRQTQLSICRLFQIHHKHGRDNDTGNTR
jgi:hypothetical protein